MTDPINPTPKPPATEPGTDKGHRNLHVARTFGQRPDGGSAETVEPISDTYYPSAAVELGEDNDHVLRLSRDDAMTNEGFKSLPNDDDELTAGVGHKEMAPANTGANRQGVRPG